MDAELTKLIHDVNARCASLKGAASLLKGASLKEERELLPLMVQRADELARALSEYARSRGIRP